MGTGLFADVRARGRRWAAKFLPQCVDKIKVNNAHDTLPETVPFSRGQTETSQGNKVASDAKDGDHHFWHHHAGSRDNLLGVDVKSILLKTREHIVFLDQDTNLHWECSAETQVRACYPKIANRVASLLARSEFLRRVHSNSFLRIVGTDNDLTNARCLIAQGIIQVLVNKPKTEGPEKEKEKEKEITENHANRVLDTAEAWITQRATEVSRLWFFRPFSFLFGASFIVLLLYLTFYPNKGSERALPYACMAAGGIGAFISSAIGCATRIPTAASAGKRLHTLEAAIRWSVGLGAGILVYLLSKTDWVRLGPPVDGNVNNLNLALLAAALLAGASERFFPSLIKKLDDPELIKQSSNH
jgi:hypothetical protein